MDKTSIKFQERKDKLFAALKSAGLLRKNANQKNYTMQGLSYIAMHKGIDIESVVGVEPKLPEYGNEAHYKTLPEGLYLGLMNGVEIGQMRDGMGGDSGPVIGPLDYAHTVYGVDLNILFTDWNNERAELYGLTEEDTLTIKDGEVLFQGISYGDWSVFYHKPEQK